MTTSLGPRRLLLLGAALVLAAAAFAATDHVLNGKNSTYLPTDRWPQIGQGVYVFGDSPPVVSPNEQPVQIASVAKVMTAYLVLKHYPLKAGESGREFEVSESDVVDTETRHETRYGNGRLTTLSDLTFRGK